MRQFVERRGQNKDVMAFQEVEEWSEADSPRNIEQSRKAVNPSSKNPCLDDAVC
jgi:hypothetical protein